MTTHHCLAELEATEFLQYEGEYLYKDVSKPFPDDTKPSDPTPSDIAKALQAAVRKAQGFADDYSAAACSSDAAGQAHTCRGKVSSVRLLKNPEKRFKEIWLSHVDGQQVKPGQQTHGDTHLVQCLVKVTVVARISCECE